MNYQLLIPLAMSGLLAACQPPSQPSAETPEQPSVEGSEAMLVGSMANTETPLPRWPVELAPYSVEKAQWPQMELLEQLAKGGVREREQLITALRSSTAEVAEWSPEKVITDEGMPPGDAAERVLRLRQDAVENALLWRLTSEEPYAARVRALLLRFAETFQRWPFYFGKERFAVNDRKYMARWDARALWGRWYPLDLPACLPLLRAYDLIRPRLTSQEQAQIERDLFVYQKELIDGFSGTGAYHNMLGYHLIALIRFGQVLERGDWVHEAVKEWSEAIVRGYTADGIYREVTVDYHSQLTHRLVNIIPDLLAGYSDPPGYRHEETGERFDALDLNTLHHARLTRIREAFPLLAKPDGLYLNTNDSWPNRVRLSGSEKLRGAGLLGAAGVAKLAVGEMAVFLKYHGIRGHDHRDGLGLSWFANGREVFSETAYRPINGEFDRAWSASTASHFTVAIDGEQHFEKRHDIPARLNTFVSQPPVNPGSEPIRATFRGASRYENQGRLLLWNAESRVAQAMEVEQPETYPGKAERFRRTLVLVPYDQHSGYLVEFFRVRGGHQHDYFLRGSLDMPYQWSSSLPMQATSGQEYQFIGIEQKGSVNVPLTATAQYTDGVQTRSFLAASPATSNASTAEYLVGSAPAIRRAQSATFTLLRHRAKAEGAVLDSAFAWVHESTTGASHIERVELQRKGESLILTIHRKDGVDTVMSNFSENETASSNGWSLKGRLAYGSESNGVRKGVLLSGEQLIGGPEPINAPPPLRGTVLAATDGAEPSARIALEPGQNTHAAGAIRLAHFDLTDRTRISIPVKKAMLEGSEVTLTLEYPTGFEPKEWGSLFYAYPGWRIQGVCHVVLE